MTATGAHTDAPITAYALKEDPAVPFVLSTMVKFDSELCWINDFGVFSSLQAYSEYLKGFGYASVVYTPPEPGQVARCRMWLNRFAEYRRDVNRSITSYGLKHQVESAWADGDPSHTYCSNGAFIMAAALEGFSLELDGRGPNCRFNIAYRRKWKAHQRRTLGRGGVRL